MVRETQRALAEQASSGSDSSKAKKITKLLSSSRVAATVAAIRHSSRRPIGLPLRSVVKRRTGWIGKTRTWHVFSEKVHHCLNNLSGDTAKFRKIYLKNEIEQNEYDSIVFLGI